MEKKEFWSRLALYVMFGGLMPFLFLVWRFELFQKVSTLSIGGWGLVAIIFISAFIIKMIKYVKSGLPFSMTTQILEGICKVTIPLFIATFCAYYLQNMMNQVFQFLCVLIVCETIAFICNPLKQWAHENNLEEEENKTKKLLETLGIVKKEEETK